MKKNPVDIPMYIGNKKIKTQNKIKISAPHNHKLHLGTFSEGDASHVKMAIESAISAKKKMGFNVLAKQSKYIPQSC